MRKALLMSMLIPVLALAAEGEPLKQGLMYLGAGLAIGLAAFGGWNRYGAFAQGYSRRFGKKPHHRW
jgi:F-type H+-transporting ATPase subunit c